MDDYSTKKKSETASVTGIVPTDMTRPAVWYNGIAWLIITVNLNSLVLPTDIRPSPTGNENLSTEQNKAELC